MPPAPPQVAYNPINISAFSNAFAGAIAGMNVSGWIIASSAASYNNGVAIAGAFAQAFDQAWNNNTNLNLYEQQAILNVCANDFRNRQPGDLKNPVFLSITNWQQAAAACVALVLSGDLYLATQGVVPPTPPLVIPPQQASIASGLVANRPNPTKSGILYLCTDVPLIYFDNPNNVPATWEQYSIAGPTTGPGPIANWTTVGAVGITQYGDSFMAVTQDSKFNAVLQPIPAPNSPYVAEINCLPTGTLSSQLPLFGTVVSNGAVAGVSTGYMIAHYDHTNGWLRESCVLGTPNHGASLAVLNIDSSFQGALGGSPLRTRIYNDGTNIFFQYSSSGIYWHSILIAQAPVATPAGLTHYGLIIGTYAGQNVGNMAAFVEKANIYSPQTVGISNITAVGSNWTFTTSNPHNMAVGDEFSVRGVVNTGAAVNGIFTGDSSNNNLPLSSVVSPTVFTANASIAIGAFNYTSGGTIFKLSRGQLN